MDLMRLRMLMLIPMQQMTIRGDNTSISRVGPGFGLEKVLDGIEENDPGEGALTSRWHMRP